MRFPLMTTLCVSLLLTMAAGAAENWTGFRGPTDQGLVEAADLPVSWSETENVAWKTPLEGKAWSSPVIWGDDIWLTAAPEDGTQLFVLRVNKNSGKVLMNKRVRHVPGPQYCIPFNSYASPSPVIEEGRVYVSFGSPFTGCLDTNTGEVLWERTDFVCDHFRGAGSSPFLYKNLLILHFDGADKQYIVAMDKQTGKTVWQTDRSVDFKDIDPATGKPNADGDFRKGFSTPVIAQVDGRDILISLASVALYAYDPLTGKELWRVEDRGRHTGSARPVAGQGLVFSAMGHSNGMLWAIRPNGSGEVTDTHIAWTYDKAVPRRSSVLLVDDLIYMVDDNGIGACVEAATGEEQWRSRLGGAYSSSPIHCNGRVYFFNQDGQTTVIATGREFKEISVNQLDDGFMASPAVSGNGLFLRTKTALYRIEN